MKAKISILLALFVMLATVLACAGSQPAVSNAYMANDEAGNNKTSTFASTDDFYVFFDISGYDSGTPLQARWYALNLEGEDPSTPFQTTDYTFDGNSTTLYFTLSKASGWPAADYKVEIYAKDEKVAEQQFSVQ